MKKIMTMLLIFALVFGFFAPATLRASGINITIDGVAIDFDGLDHRPRFWHGQNRILVPIYGFFEHLGFEVDIPWSGPPGSDVTLTRDSHEVSLFTTRLWFTVNGVVFCTGTNVHQTSSRHHIPLRAIVEAVGYTVEWDDDTNTANINTTPRGNSIEPAYVTIQNTRLSTTMTIMRHLPRPDWDWNSETPPPRLQSEDIVPLRYMTNLTYLHLTDHEISDITPLADLTNLTHLSLGFNQINDISPLTNLTNLRGLAMQANGISDITALASLTELRTLDVSINPISDITPLADLQHLQFVNLLGTEVMDWSPVGHLPRVNGRPYQLP